MSDQESVWQASDKDKVLQLLREVGEIVSVTLGDWCEVVVHDLADLEHSLVWIGGNVTGRKVGGPMTDLGLSRIRSRDTEPIINYTTYTEDGKTLRSSTLFIHDEHGSPMAVLCINLNVTAFLLFERFLQRMVPKGHDPEVTEFFADEIGQTVDTIVANAAYEIGKPMSLMSKDDRLQMVALLEAKGIFQLKRSVPLVAGRLGVTEKTIYNYLAELQLEGGH